MKVWAALSNAVAGWMMILRGDAGWRERFARTMPGLTTALIIFAVIAFLAVAFASMSIGMPSLFGVVAAMFVLALPITALVVSLLGTRMMLKSREPALDVMVPGTYLLTAFLLVEGLLAIIGGPVVLLSWLGLAYLLYRLARAATGWTVGIAAGFAVLTVVLLVAMRLALYMLSNAAISPI
ncbi:hypothetical protein [Devosia sp. A449]